MIGAAEIEKMTLEEKLEAMELLWKSISEKPDEVPSPWWHEQIIAARLAKIDKGEGKFLSIEEARQRLRKSKP
jgi:Putative addiction module component